MKKFLFTLAALLMAGSSFAANQWVIDDVVLTDAELANGGAKVINMVGKFDTFVSAWQADITLPEGCAITTVIKGADLTQTINVMMVDEETLEEYVGTEDYTPTINLANNNTRIIVSTLDKKYYSPEGEYWGTVHWTPGEWTLHRMRITWPAGFEGGDVTITTGFTSGAAATQPRPGFIPAPTGVADDVCTFHIGKAEAPQPEEFTATPSVTFAGNVATLSYTSNDADAVATVTVNGVETAVEWNNGTATYTVTEGTEVGTHNVVVVLTVAPGPDESHEGEAVSANATYTYTVKPNFVANPTITFDTNGVATLNMNANDPNATAVVTVDGTEVNVAFVDGVATLPLTLSTEVGDHSIVVSMTVSPSADYEGQSASATANYNYTVNPEITPAPACNIQITETEEYAEITIDNYTEYMITVNGTIVDQFPTRALPYKVMRTYEDQLIKVTAKNDPNPALYTPATDSKELTLTAKDYEASNPATLGTPYTDANNLYIPVNGNVQSITVDGAPYALNAAGQLVLPRAEQPWTPEIEIVTNDGQYHNDATANFDDITVPAWVTVPAIELVEGNSNGHWVDSYVDDQGNPVWGHMEYDETGHNMVVNFSTTYEDAVLYWQILNEDGEIIQSGNTEDQTASSEPIYENGNYTAVAWVVLPNDESRRNTRDFEIDDMTNVNELVNGKTVANVRYFNVAGQEMQEANGMTIVVTTYTDGTTSTVKVMK